MKVKFDVSGSDPKDAFKGGAEPPKPGVYKGKIVDCKVGAKQGDPDAKRLEVTIEIIDDKKYKGARLYDYIAFSEASQWKMDQFLQVLGITSKSKRKGTFDTDDVVGEVVKIRVAGDTYNGEYRAKLAAYLPGGKDDDDEDDDDADEVDVDEDDDEDFDDDEEEESDDEEDEDEDEEESEDDDVPPYDEWDIEELKAECKARKLKIKPGSKKVTYVKALEADDEASEGDDEDEDDEEDPF